VKEEFGTDVTQTVITFGFSAIPTLSHLRTYGPISHSSNPLVGISTNPQQSLPQQAL
jgi:hypothetical protein